MPFALLSEYKRRTPHIIYGGTDMKLFITFSKRSLAAVLLALIAALAVLSRVTALSGGDIGGATNAERVDYMNSLGCNVEETAVSFKKTVICCRKRPDLILNRIAAGKRLFIHIGWRTHRERR